MTTWDELAARIVSGVPAYDLNLGDLEAVPQPGAWQGTWASILNTLGRGTGKRYWEGEANSPTYGLCCLGMQNNTGVNVITTASQPGQSTYGISFSDWGAHFQASEVLDMQTMAARPVAIAVDLTARLIWEGFDNGSGTTWDKMWSRRSTVGVSGASYFVGLDSPWLNAIAFGEYSNCKSIRSTSWRNEGKFYFEAQMNNPSGGCGIGIINDIPNVRTAAYIPGGFSIMNAGIGWVVQETGILYNDSFVLTMPHVASTHWVCIAVDFDARLIWFRDNAGNWNDNGSANPATGTGGISFSAIDPPYFVCGTVLAAASNITINFGNQSFTQTPPAGFADWDDGVTRMVWNNSDDTGAQDPATGTGGFDISGVTGDLFPCLASLDIGYTCIGRFAEADMALPIPSGFLAWDADEPPPPTPGRYVPLIMPM